MRVYGGNTHPDHQCVLAHTDVAIRLVCCFAPVLRNIIIFIEINNSYDQYCGCRPDNMYRADSRIVPSKWETVLLCNVDSHWLGGHLESALIYLMIFNAICYNSQGCSVSPVHQNAIHKASRCVSRYNYLNFTRIPYQLFVFYSSYPVEYSTTCIVLRHFVRVVSSVVTWLYYKFKSQY